MMWRRASSASPRRGPEGRRLLRRLLLVAFFLEVGLLLIVLPWSGFWEGNYFGRAWPTIGPLLTNDFIRGAVSGTVEPDHTTFVIAELSMLGGEWTVSSTWPYDEKDKMAETEPLARHILDEHALGDEPLHDPVRGWPLEPEARRDLGRAHPARSVSGDFAQDSHGALDALRSGRRCRLGAASIAS